MPLISDSARYFVALGVKYFHLPFIPALIGAPIAAGLGAALFGWLCVRLSGVYPRDAYACTCANRCQWLGSGSA